MQTRPARLDDVPTITGLLRGQDEFWFGAPEFDEAEVREEFEPVTDPDTQSALVFDGDSLVGASWWWGRQTFLCAAAGPSRPKVIGLLLDTLAEAGLTDGYCLARDAEFVDAFAARGWEHTYSAYDLYRAVDPAWTLPEPGFPDGVEVGSVTEAQLPDLHTMIYEDARWADVSGHVRREFDEWRTLFAPVSGTLVARRGERIVGAAITRTYSDGAGIVTQLAVAHDERGRGLGRALLLAGLRNRRDAGAARLGLGVQAANTRALRLYESVGLRVEREYRSYRRHA